MNVSLFGIMSSTITGNTMYNNNIETKASNSELGDYNGAYGENHGTGEWGDVDGEGNFIVSMLIGRYADGNTITGNTIVAQCGYDQGADTSKPVGYGLFIDYSVTSNNVISDNSFAGSDVGLCDARD